MCGIFGLALDGHARLSNKEVTKLINQLFVLSESRGKEASGLALRDDAIEIYKQAISASEMIQSKPYKALINRHFNPAKTRTEGHPVAFIGHSRLVTNGNQSDNQNNQPVSYEGLVGIHNGIISNVDELWASHPELKRGSKLDSEVILALTNKYYQASQSLFTALAQVYREIEGAASIATLFNDEDALLLASNTGSLYYALSPEKHLLLFASERYILEKLLKPLKALHSLEIKQIQPYEACLINLKTFELNAFNLKSQTNTKPYKPLLRSQKLSIEDLSNEAEQARNTLKRCTKCVLPETMPFIRFNQQGVCNYCENYRPAIQQGEEALLERVAPFRKPNGSPECILAFSGGRDSSYGLHYITQVLKLKPIAYTYDWGMVTDLARRNQARMCGKLGVEHILISADIKRKRNHIKKNISAWLKQPALGTVPIFMAGDKQYISYPAMLGKRTNTELVFFCRNQMEKTNFKTGFCGVNEAGKWYYEISYQDKAKIIAYYLKHYATNWSYFNSSLIDNLAGIYHSFFVDRTHYLQLFNYLNWDETTIDSTLKDEYNWEFATDTDSSWRIGDGTAAFYNYIYYTVAGFSEIDTFRSNQIREGLINREDALAMVQRENQPRYDSIQEYAHIIGFDCDEALKRINAMPKLYMK